MSEEPSNFKMRMRDPDGEVSLVPDWRDDRDTRREMIQAGKGVAETMRRIPVMLQPYKEDAAKARRLADRYQGQSSSPHMVRIGEALRAAEAEISKRLVQEKQELRASVDRGREKEQQLKDCWEDNRRKQGRIQILEELTNDPEQLDRLKTLKNNLQEESKQYESAIHDVAGARRRWEGRI